MELGFFTMPIHPPGRQLARDARGGPRARAARRPAGLRRGLHRRARHRCGGEHQLRADLHRLAAARDDKHQARHRHRQPAEPPSGDGRGRGGAGRPHGQGPLHLRHQPGRPAVGCRGVRQPRQGPHRDVRRGDRPDPRDLERRAALRARGQILERLDRAHADPRARPGHDRQALPAAASADRGDRGGAVLQGRDRGGGARLGPDLGELPAAAVGQDPLAELRGGLRAGRPDGGSQELAGRQEHLRRRRPRDGAALRDRPRRGRTTSTTDRCSPSSRPRAAPTCSRRTGTSPTTS